ncbi:MAG: 3-hydroxyisobutyrate dehydrogenase [Bacilli bacterium]|nr:3-hydroxyisobutyrate dehydrogenase [Bacilli bacterium]
MKRIGFIGLGTMGLPMARHLIQAGYPLTVYNRTANKSESLRALGATIAASPAEVARASEIVFTMLTADQAVKEVILGETGVMNGAAAGLVVVDCSTISPKTSQLLAEELAKKGVEMLDAPVTGSEPQAIEGILTFMAGGKQEVFEECRTLFDVMGKKAFYMGKSGAGSYTKLANNTMTSINLLSLSESIVMAVKSGIDPELFVEVVSGGGARSGMVDTKAPKMFNRDFHANFATVLMHKDLGLAMDVAADLQLPVPMLALAKQMLQLSITKGYGQEDMSAVVKCYEEWAGIEVKKSNK